MAEGTHWRPGGRRRHGHQRARRDQHRHADRQRAHGLDAARRHHRAGASAIGTDAFQECDITGITMGITKHNFLVKSAQEIPRAVAAAFHLATTGRPGPVLIDIPKDVAQSMMDWWYPRRSRSTICRLPPRGRRSTSRIERRCHSLPSRNVRSSTWAGAPSSRELPRAARVRRAHRHAGRHHVDGRGAFPDSHDQHLGMPGMHGMYTAVTAIQKSDLLISLGARFDDRVTGKVSRFRGRRQGDPRRHRQGRSSTRSATPT